MNIVKNLVIENKNLVVIAICCIIALIVAVILYKKSSKNNKYYEEEETRIVENNDNISSDVSSDKLEYKKNLRISGKQLNIIDNNDSSESSISVEITDDSNSSTKYHDEFSNPIVPNGTPAPISYESTTTTKTELPTQIGIFRTTGELQKS